MINSTDGKRNTIFDREIFLLDIWKMLIKKWWLIVLVSVLCGGITFAGTKLFVEPTYESSFTAYVNNSNQNINNDTLTTADITAARNLTSTYATIIKSQPDIEAAIQAAGLNLAYENVIDNISVNTLNDTEIIRVSVITTDPDTSYKIASSLQKVAPDYVAGIVAGSSMMVIEPARHPTSIYGPNYLLNVIIGIILGDFILMIALIIYELMDDRVKDVDELNRYGIVVIGTVHDLATSKSNGYGYYGYERRKENNGL